MKLNQGQLHWSAKRGCRDELGIEEKWLVADSLELGPSDEIWLNQRVGLSLRIARKLPLSLSEIPQ